MALAFAGKIAATPLFTLPVFSVSAFHSLNRSHNKILEFNRILFSEPQVQSPFKLRSGCKLIAKSSSENLDVDPALEPQSEDEDEDIEEFKDFPIDANLQLKLEHRLKLKLPKNVRIRGKKLLRRRRMRKKVQKPPSKMNNNKNV